MADERAGVTVVVPTYNERENIPVLLERMEAAFAAASRPLDMLVMDDDSPDGTAAVAAALGESGERAIRSIRRTEDRGLSQAVIHGLREAKYDLCVCIDADLSHPPEKVPELVDAVESGAPFALGSRYVEGGEMVGWGGLRLVNSIGATLLARPLTRVADPMSGFFCVRRSAVPFEELNPIGYKIALEVMVKMGVDQPREIPITFTDRLHGESKLTLKEQLKYVTHLERLYKWRWPFATQFVEFCLVGGTGMIVDFAILTALVELGGVYFGLAQIPAFMAALTFNFLVNDAVTFASADHRAWGMGMRYAMYAAACAVGGMARWATSLWLYETLPFFSEHYLLSAFVGVVAGTAINFTGARWVVFRKA